jgi:hypothetical protein
MQSHRTDPPGFDAYDPEGQRLTPQDVIAINRAQLAGVGWNEIARQFNTSRKNVSRIVRGQRWNSLHPNVAPHLYEPTPVAPVEPPPDPVVSIVNTVLRDARDRILKELREAA